MADQKLTELTELPSDIATGDSFYVVRSGQSYKADADKLPGGGDVVGPAAATDGAVAKFDGTTGKLLKDGVILGDAATKSVGTTAGTVAAGDDSRLSNARTPTAHKTSHENGGADEISVAGLSGVLADPQPPIIGAGATQAVAGNDARLTDARTPSTHKTSHATGGSDALAAADIGAAAAAKFIAGAGALTGPAAPLTIGTAAANATGDFATATQGGKADTALQPTSSINDLADVDTTGVVVDQTLRYNGANWVPGTIPTSAGGAGQDFFHDQASVTPSSAENGFAIETLTTVPSGNAEVVEAVALATNTVVVDGYLGPVLGRTTIPAGTWEFDLYASVSSTGGGRVTTCTRNIFQVVPLAGTPLTTTGTGTSRTATIGGGATPFVAGDANANQLLASWLQTPKGLYQITGFTSSTVVTIATPAAYVNESGVAASRWKYLFGAQSDPITALTTSYARYFRQSFQSAFTIALTDRIGSIAFGTSNNTTTLNFVYQGTTRQTHFTAPTVVLHNDLPGLQGGTTAQFFHLTQAELTALSAVIPDSRMPNLTGDVTTTEGAVATTIAADAVTNAKLANMANATIKGRTTAGTGDPEDLTAAQALGVLGFTSRLESIWVPADSMRIPTTAGAPAGTIGELATNKQMIGTLDFDAAADEYAQFTVAMPKSWNEGTVTAQFLWGHAATTTNFDVVWALQGVAVSNDDALDASWGTEQAVTDTGGTTNDLYITAATSAITIGGTPAAEDLVLFRVYRDANAGGDTLAIDAKLIGVKLFITLDAITDA